MGAEITPALFQVLQQLRRQDATTRERIELMHNGSLGLFEILPGGERRDLTDEAINRDEATLALHAKIYRDADPDNLTSL